jgi:hypothetical protein
MSEPNKASTTKRNLKVLGILAISALALVAVAFGLVVGVCKLGR